MARRHIFRIHRAPWFLPPVTGRAHAFRHTAERLGAIWVLRVLLSDPATDKAGVRLDDDVAEAIGLPHLADHGTRAGRRPPMRERLEARLRELESSSVVEGADVFTRNTATLARVLGLTETERQVLTLALVMRVVDGLAGLFRELGPAAFSEACRLAAIALGAPEADVRRALRVDGALRETGLLSVEHELTGIFMLSAMSGVAEAMLAGRCSARAIMRMFVREAPATKLAVADFAHAADDVAAIVRLVRGALRRRAHGVNVLLHGAPGTGKTELVRVVAKAVGAALYEVGDANEEGDPTLGRDRLSECAIAQRTLAWTPRALLVFDELEDAFRVRREGSLGLTRESSGVKSWTHRLMERAPLPVFWIANEVNHVDPAMLRRFDLVVELKVPPTAVRMSMLREALGTTPVDDALLGRLASDQRLTPAHVARAVRVVTKLMAAREPKDVSSALSHVLGCNLSVQGPARVRSTIPLVCGPYALDFVNATADLGMVTDAIVREKRATVCLYGLPGTGKTMWVQYLAERMQVPLRAARASDLLDCYVGETEKNIAKLFSDARDEGALLFLDEADSFLQDRTRAVRSWEITQVNQLLVCMEEFSGVFICATNLVDTLDRASLRRFAMKIEFKALRSDARWAMLLRLAPAAEGDRALRVVLDRLDGLTAGDFAAVARQSRLAGAQGDARALLAMLERELLLKRVGSGRAIGFEAGVGS